MNAKDIATIIQRATEIHNESYVPHQREDIAGAYAIDIDESIIEAMKSQGITSENEPMWFIIYLALDSWMNDALDWSAEVLNSDGHDYKFDYVAKQVALVKSLQKEKKAASKE